MSWPTILACVYVLICTTNLLSSAMEDTTDNKFNRHRDLARNKTGRVFSLFRSEQFGPRGVRALALAAGINVGGHYFW